MLRKIWNELNPWYFFSDEFYNLFGTAKDVAVTLFSLFIIALIDVFRRIGFDLRGYLLEQQIIYRWVFYFAVIFIIMLWGAYGSGYEQTQFIYFQF